MGTYSQGCLLHKSNKKRLILNVGTTCKTATKIIIVCLGLVLISSALFLSVSAETIEVPFTWTSVIVEPWQSTLSLSLSQIETTPVYVINPFVKRQYQVGQYPNYAVEELILIDEPYEYYGVILRNDNSNTTGNTSLAVSTSNISNTAGAINTITLEFCIPSAGNYTDYINDYEFSLVVGGVQKTPDNITIISSDKMTYLPIVGAPVDSQTLQAFKVMLYFDSPFEVNQGAYFTMSIPVRAFNFNINSNIPVGIVWGYNSINVDFYSTLVEAQNANIINSLTKFPNKVKYEEDINNNESLSDSLSQAGNFEQSLYDNLSIADGLPPDIDNNVAVIFGEMSFLWEQEWLVILITTGIGLAVLSYALYGGS